MTSDKNPSDAVHRLHSAVHQRWEQAHSGKTRIVVQVGHCSQAVGAGDIARTIANSLPDHAYMVTAGCDGGCFASPKISITLPSGASHTYWNVSADMAHDLAQKSFCIDTNALTGADVSEAENFFNKQHRLILQDCGEIDAISIDEYILNGGYSGLAKALSLTPEDVIEKVSASGLRGRGGAYFPAALKWRGARSVRNTPRYLVVNCEEGEPGIFKDRHLMEGVPHRIIEGAVIAAYASDVHEAFIYINAEANLSAERMQTAIDQAYSCGLLGDDILSSGYNLDVRIIRGAGGYVCGDETTLLNTMEGYRREPRQRPPFPTDAGLWGKPTVINNAETLASVPFILANGNEAFAATGTDTDKGTKIISISGSVKRPGIAEVPMGTTLRKIIYEIGGGSPAGRTITSMAVGGPSSGIFPASMLDTPIKPGFLHESGVMLGAGGVIALDERIGVLETLRKLAAYNANESCGKCTPCREGTPRIVELVDDIAAGKSNPSNLDALHQLAELVNTTSLCGLGQAAGNPVLSALHFFGGELTKTR